MIIKLGERLKWEMFRRKRHYVRAVRFNEDFLYETKSGWVQGFKGQWLVELGERLRCNVDHESFVRAHKPARKRRGHAK